MVVEMIVHSVTALVIAHFRCRNGTEISEVIVAEHQGNAVKLRIAHQAGGLVIAVEIRLYFLIQSEHSGDLVQVFIYILADEFVLRLQYFSEQIDIVFKRCVLAHDGSISLAAHTDSDDILELAASFETVFPESRDAFLVLKEVPGIAVNGVRAS